MVTLTPEDRDELRTAIAAGYHDHTADEKVAAVVEHLITEARAAALNEAAEQIEPGGTGGPYDLPEHWSAIERLSFLSGMDRAARIVRNLAANSPP